MRSDSEIALPSASPPKTYAELILQGLCEANVEIVATLPESLLKPLYPLLRADPRIRYIQVSNEIDLPGIVAGAYFGGKRAVMIMENSGLRQACEPIARLTFGHRIPLVMIMPHRGDLGEEVWWGHGHSETMVPLLEALRIRHWSVNALDDIVSSIKKAVAHADAGQVATALILSGACREPHRYA